jgi:glutamyl-tRNA reductase
MQSMIPQSPHLLVVGVNHRTAPLAVREVLAFTPERATQAIRQIQQQFPGAQAVILSTCNRVEVYLSAEQQIPQEAVKNFLAAFHALPAHELGPHLYHHENHAAIHHLFAVASSLDSMVVGETQILAQVKAAYQHAREAGGVGKEFHSLFQRALAAAKDVHEKTDLSAGHLSIASVAVDVARSVFDRFDDKTVVCVGAGKMSSLMLKHLAALRPGKLLITNRSLPRAQAVAAEFNAVARPFEELNNLLVEADILLTSTGAEQPIITAAQFKALQKPRRYRPIVMVDIAVPRDIEAAVGKLSNAYLYNIDDLQEVAAGNRSKRDDHVTASRILLQQHVDEFLQWYAARDVGPVVKALYERCHEIARSELEALFNRNPNLSAEQRAELERLTHRLIGKLLHTPVAHLTSQTHPQVPAEDHLPRHVLGAALKKLFNLETPGPQQPPQKPE